MYDVIKSISKLLPEKWRLSSYDCHLWHIPFLRDFWWRYWDELKKGLEELEQMDKNIDWDKEEVFFFLS